jgi:hypothetical protein
MRYAREAKYGNNTQSTPMQYKVDPSTRSKAKALALAGALLASQACAMSLREFQALEKTDPQGEHHAHYYLVGVMEGELEAHQHATRSGAKAVICLKGRSLEPRMARQLFDAERQRNAGVYEADMPVALVMSNALAQAYPC